MKAEVGDILKFEKPIYDWHADDIAAGAYYVVTQDKKKKFYQTEDGWWHCKELDELDEPQLVLRGKEKGCYVFGDFKNFADRKFEVVGHVGG